MASTKPSLADRAVRLLPWTLVLAVVSGIAFLYLQRQQALASEFVSGALFWNPSPGGGVTEYPYRQLADQLDGLVFVPSHGPSFDAIRNQAREQYDSPLPINTWIGVFESKDSKLVVVTNPRSIDQALEAFAVRNRSTAPLRFAILVAIAGMMVGVLAGSRLSFVDKAYPFLALALLAALFLGRCKSCNETDVVFGFDRAALGAAFFAGLAAVQRLLPATLAHALLLCGAAGTAAYQFSLFALAVDTCWLCLSVLALSSLVLGSAFVPTQQASAVLPRPLTRTKIAMTTVLGIASLGFLIAGRHTNEGVPLMSYALESPRSEQATNLIGTNVSTLQIRTATGGAVTISDSVVLLGSDSCAPCLWAAKSTISWEEPTVFVVAYSERYLVNSGPFSSYYAESIPTGVGTPTLLVVDSTGTIVDQFVGWSQDKVVAEDRRSRSLQAISGKSK